MDRECMFQEIIAFLSPVTLCRPSRAPQWAHTGVPERAMSLITGVAVTWVPSAKMACLTAVRSGSPCKCEVTPWHLGFHAQEKLHSCMHWCTPDTLYVHTHTHINTHTEACTHKSHIHTDSRDTWESCRQKYNPQSSNNCQSALRPLWKNTLSFKCPNNTSEAVVSHPLQPKNF